MKELQHLNKYIFTYRYKLLIGIAITILAKIFALFTPRLVGESINIIVAKLNGEIDTTFKADLTINILYLVGAAIIAGGFTFLKRQTIINVSRYIEYH